jgi:branched-chain amino acid transport system permease protein
MFAGLAGGLYGQLDRQVTPEQLYWIWSAKLVLATVLGGMRQFLGPVVGAAGLVVLQDIALRWTEYRGLVLGAILVVVVQAFPGGVAGAATALVDRIMRRWGTNGKSTARAPRKPTRL